MIAVDIRSTNELVSVISITKCIRSKAIKTEISIREKAKNNMPISQIKIAIAVLVLDAKMPGSPEGGRELCPCTQILTLEELGCNLPKDLEVIVGKLYRLSKTFFPECTE